jgi:bis(5'-nucleosyl)-tetraphosphatase (symmetrical)
MSTYVIGDIHGCYESLKHLLMVAGVTEDDQILCVGDLINRGPCSLEVLEWAMQHQHQVQVILGNHELHFLACLFGATLAKGDTLDRILEQPSTTRNEIFNWLRVQPILFETQIQQKRLAMLHAGLNPQWTWSEVRERARRIERELKTDQGLETLALAHPSRKKSKLKSKGPSLKTSTEKPGWIEDLKWFTRVRTIDHKCRPVGWFKGNPMELPSHLTPWFDHYSTVHNQSYPDMLYYGHWAAFGLQSGSCYYGLDTGCIWGNMLSAVRVEDGAVFQVSHREIALTPKHLRQG